MLKSKTILDPLKLNLMADAWWVPPFCLIEKNLSLNTIIIFMSSTLVVWPACWCPYSPCCNSCGRWAHTSFLIKPNHFEHSQERHDRGLLFGMWRRNQEEKVNAMIKDGKNLQILWTHKYSNMYIAFTISVNRSEGNYKNLLWGECCRKQRTPPDPRV